MFQSTYNRAGYIVRKDIADIINSIKKLLAVTAVAPAPGSIPALSENLLKHWCYIPGDFDYSMSGHAVIFLKPRFI